MLPGFVHVRKSQIQALFKAMYQQIQGLNTEEKGLLNLTLNCSKGNFNEFRTALSDMNMGNQFNKMSVLSQTISENIQKLKQEKFKEFQILLYKFKDIQGLEFLFSNSRTFKDFQILYEPCVAYPHYLYFIFDGNQFHSTLIWRSWGIFI
jgi:hypothetical protein